MTFLQVRNLHDRSLLRPIILDPIMNGKFVQNVPTILGMNSSEFAAMMGSFTPNLMEGWSEEEFVANLGPMLHVSGEVSKDFLKRAKKNYKMDSNDKMRYSKLFLQTYADDVSAHLRNPDFWLII